MDAPLPEPPPLPPTSEGSGNEEPSQKSIVIPNLQAAIQRKRRARRNLILIIAGIVIAGAVVWGIEEFSSIPFRKIAAFETQVTSDVQQEAAALPTPLKSKSRVSPKDAMLTVEGVIADTNASRAASSEPPLAENATLDDIATLRVDDMFTHQYFAHVSPSGQSAITVASSVGYNHLALGENLAEGMFNGDQGLVDAWMASPGHRANILDTHYTQIGVAVREGMFAGQETWIAVQVFGKPTSACPPAPDPSLQTAIADAEAKLTTMSAELARMKSQIDAMQPQSGAAYNAQVSQYNALVGQYNLLVAQTKTEVAQYDAAVTAYNACL